MLKTTFRRKVGYLCAIAALFVPLAYISAPATDSKGIGGGLLSRMRHEERLSQAQLGKIDPASASMSLATFGLRGVAANQLWTHAHHYKKTENWDAFKATLNQISKLQPNFVSVWQFQAWNISYNVSVEFDNYEHRYHWVKKGVDYLLEGSEYNRDEPLLLWDTGWFFGHKMGRADEHKQFRRLFRNDEDFHNEVLSDLDFADPANQGPDGKPDNWKVAHHYFSQAQEAVDSGKRLKSLSRMGYWAGEKRIIGKKETALKGKNPLVFHSDPPKALINYADAIEEDGYLDEVGQLAWRMAGRAWTDYGDRPILSSYGIRIQLNDRERNVRDAEEANKELEAMASGIRERLEKERHDALTPEQLEAMDVAPAVRTQEQSEVVYAADQSLKVTLEDIAEETSEELRTQAMLVAHRSMAATEQVRIIDRYREVVNFVYWAKRCEVEQKDETVAARKLVLNADLAFADADIERAKEQYEKAWDIWDGILEEYEVLIDDVEGEILFEAVERYERVLGQLEVSFPPDGFREKKSLMSLVEEFAEDGFVTSPTEEATEDEEEATEDEEEATEDEEEPTEDKEEATEDKEEATEDKEKATEGNAEQPESSGPSDEAASDEAETPSKADSGESDDESPSPDADDVSNKADDEPKDLATKDDSEEQ